MKIIEIMIWTHVLCVTFHADADSKSPKIGFYAKMVKIIEKIAKMQKYRNFALEPRSRELFACQKPVFFLIGFFKNHDFHEIHRKIMKIRIQIPEFREESISDHPGGQN